MLSGVGLAFEPSERNFCVLKLNILANRFRNVRLFKVALADKMGRAVLGIPIGRFLGENTLAVDSLHAKQVEVVELKRFDEIAEQEGISKVDIIKIDVEGAEYRVLQGFGKYLDSCEYILLEVHPSQMIKLGTSPKRLYMLLDKHGFNLYWLDENFGITPVNLSELFPRILTRHHVVGASSSLDLDNIRLKLRKYSLISPTSFDKRQKATISLNNALNAIKGIVSLRL